MKNLIKIQAELKAPKNQWNDFGKYHYRSCEDILEAAKLLCDKYGCTLMLYDEIELIGDRYYIKATASIQDGEEVVKSTAYAREPQTKKGMDESQVTGSASSYARKYALNGLFLIDDTKDPDANESKKESNARSQRKQNQPAKQPTNREMVIAAAKKKGKDLNDLAKEFGITKETTEERFSEILKEMNK